MLTLLPRSCRPALGLVVLAALSGCGDYDQRMSEAQKKIDRIDEDNSILGWKLDPFKLVTDGKEVKTESTSEVFVRGTKNIRSKPEDKPLVDTGSKVAVYRYVREDNYPGPVQEMHLAVGASNDAGFEKAVLEAAGGYLQEFVAEPQRVQKELPGSARRELLKFNVYKGSKYSYRLFVCARDNGPQVAVGFREDATQPAEKIAKAEDASIDSLLAGAGVQEANQSWSRSLALRPKKYPQFSK